MAKKIIQPKSMEEALWEACNKLRGSIESSEYKHVVLSLIFLKYAGDRFEKRRQEIVAEGHEAFADNVAFYAAKNVFYLAPESRWDYIMANPPFNQKAWREESELTNDPRWAGFDVPPTSNANYGWILNMVSKLSSDGVAGFILANGALSADGTEYAIRKKMLERGLVEAILILPRNLFYTTDISVTLWILNNNKKARVANRNGEEVHYRDREKEVLFMDLRQMGSPYEKKYVQLTAADIARVARTYHDWQRAGDGYHDIPEYCYSATFDEIAEKNFSLVPSKYIEFVNRDEQIDFDSKMKQLQSEMKELLAEEEKSKAELKALFEKLGYKI